MLDVDELRSDTLALKTLPHRGEIASELTSQWLGLENLPVEVMHSFTWPRWYECR
jgi:hypothetical protein